MVKKGDTFLLSDGFHPRTGKELIHLWFAISDPDIDDTVLVVNSTTYYGNGQEDASCILKPGDHPNIKQESWINYEKAWSQTVNFIEKEINNKNKINRNIIAVSDEILKKIQTGAKKTDALKEKYKKYFEYF